MKKPNIKPIQVAKFVASAVAGSGTSIVVKQVIKNNVTPENKYQTIGVLIGTAVISGMIGVQANRYAEGQVDKAVDVFTQVKEQIEAQKTTLEA